MFTNNICYLFIPTVFTPWQITLEMFFFYGYVQATESSCCLRSVKTVLLVKYWKKSMLTWGTRQNVFTLSIFNQNICPEPLNTNCTIDSACFRQFTPFILHHKEAFCKNMPLCLRNINGFHSCSKQSLIPIKFLFVKVTLLFWGHAEQHQHRLMM